MEFYDTAELQCASKNKGFNSQRDGILPGFRGRGRRIRRLFQFPTGWNSTRLFEPSIEKDILFQFPTGWNSTIEQKEVQDETIVSIPNGMEFYRATDHNF